MALPDPISDSDFKRERKRLRKLLRKWAPRLWLNEWHVILAYSRGPFMVDGEMALGTLGSCSVVWEYRRATITFDVEATRNHSDADLEHAFVHECMHILVNEMRNDAENGNIKGEERVCELLTYVIMGLAA